MTCRSHTALKSRSSGSRSTPTDIITYRYDGKLVYVPAVSSYNQALSHARDAFPQLRNLADASLSLSLTAPSHGDKFVSISASAWPMLCARMSRYQVIDVHVTRGTEKGVVVTIPEITITYATDTTTENAKGSDPVPPYRAVDDEKASHPHEQTAPASTGQSIKRNWLLQKLHGQ